MTERPIIFSGEMVRAILDGTKTQTRRPLKPQPELRESRISFSFRRGKSFCNLPYPIPSDSTLCCHSSDCPFGQVGDRLWVRETFCLEQQVEDGEPPPFDDGRPIRWEYEGLESDLEGAERWFQPHYRATDPTPELAYEDTDGEPTVRWKPSIHMPRWASRITLEITDIRIERLQEITEEEARAEGFFAHDGMTAAYWFSEAWDSLYARKGIGWNDNPWVWVITFRRVG